MALQNRRGNNADFDATKMLPAELAVSLDEKKVYVAFAPGDVKEFAFKDDLHESEVTDEQVRDAVNDYLTKNPVASGATEEQAAQIEQNKSKIEQIQEDVKNKEESGTAENKVTEHNVSTVSHNDIRLLIQNALNAFEAFMDIDDESMNQATEFVAYMKDNRELIEQITTSKVSVSDIVDDYVTNVSNKPVSAAVAVKLKALIDAITVPTLLSQLGQDSTHRTVTDAEKETWNNKANKATTLAGYGITDGATKAELSEISEQIDNLQGLEPNDDDLPKVFLTGDEFSNMTIEKNEVNMELEYKSKTKNFHAYILIKYQGQTSLNFAKKNFTIKLYSDEARVTKQKHAFRDWEHENHKYVLKANWIDHTHARNIISANLWNEVVSSRSDYSSLPTELRNSPKNGAIDGFPVKLYVNGTYQGIYTWNIGKDDWMWGMDEDNANHALLCVTHNTNGVFKDRAYNFRAIWSGVDGEAFDIEVGTNSDALKTCVNNMLSFVINNNGSAFTNGIGNYLDIQSAIDYYIHQYVICGLDGLGKNMLLGTYDMKKIYLGAYDMDAIFGLWYDGKKFVSTNYKCPEDYQEKFNLLFERIEENFWTELQERYSELRKTVYSIGNLITSFERFTDKIGSELFTEDLEVYSGIPLGDSNNIKQLRNFIRDRLAYCDEQILNGVPATGIVLSEANVKFNTNDEVKTKTLTAAKTPNNTTDDIMWWSDNETIATVSNGVVTAIADGTCNIYAKCGSGYDVCSVTVTSEVTPSYTNQVPISIDTDGSIYNGTGYKNTTRLSSSGSAKDDTNTVTTGFITASSDDIIRVKGYTWYNTSSSVNYLIAYDEDFNKIYAGNSSGGYDTDSLIESMSLVDGISVIKLKAVANIKYIRLSIWNSPTPDGANLIVTVNEEITE